MMDLERLAAALGADEVVGPAPVEVLDLAYDARHVTPGAAFFCVPGARADGHDFAPRRSRTAPSRSSSSAALPVDVPQLVVPDARAAMALAADELFGRPTEALQVAGVTGTSGKTTTSFLLYAILAAAGRRPGLLGTVEARVGGERRGVVRTTPEAIDLQRLFREMLDAGDRSCAMEASSHALGAAPSRPRALRGPRLHEPQPGPSRLPRRHGVVLPGEAAAVPDGAAAARGRQRRRRVRPAARGRASRRGHVQHRRRGQVGRRRPEAARPVQRRERAGRARRGARARHRRRRDQARASNRCAACRGASSPSRRGSPSRSSSTTRTSPTRSRRSCAPRATSRTGA